MSKAAPKDTVILYQIPRGPRAPSLSPFPLKLETYLRMAKIPYENVLSNKLSSKGKTPWIEYNGVAVADSQFCIDYLNKQRNIDLNSHLSDEQRATARAFQKLAEENLYWCLALDRWVYGDKQFMTECIRQVFPLPGPLVWFTARTIKKEAWGHGIGRHTPEEMYTIFDADMKALSDFIGNKSFLMGDEPCENDCAIFGQIAQIWLHSPEARIEKSLKDKFPNLIGYCERMKARFWPDWDEVISK